MDAACSHGDSPPITRDPSSSSGSNCSQRTCSPNGAVSGPKKSSLTLPRVAKRSKSFNETSRNGVSGRLVLSPSCFVRTKVPLSFMTLVKVPRSVCTARAFMLGCHGYCKRVFSFVSPQQRARRRQNNGAW